MKTTLKKCLITLQLFDKQDVKNPFLSAHFLMIKKGDRLTSSVLELKSSKSFSLI